jgi:Phage integrase family.
VNLRGRLLFQLKVWGIFFNTIFKMINEGRIGANVLLFALLTGIRKSEATEGLRWENVDLKDRTFYISHTKNGTPHKLPLTNYTFEMLNNISIKNGNPSSGIVFLSHVVEKRFQILEYVEAEIEKALELRVTIHDLRRTFSTLAARVLTHYEHKKLMNHYDNRDVTMTHYVVFDVEDLRIPLQKLEDYILSLK